VAQVIECLLSKCEAQNSVPTTVKKKKKKKEKEKGMKDIQHQQSSGK
jgi:hypothetical protein